MSQTRALTETEKKTYNSLLTELRVGTERFTALFNELNQQKGLDPYLINLLLVQAVDTQNKEIVKFLIDNKADVNFKFKDDHPLIVLALINEKFEMVEFLIEQKEQYKLDLFPSNKNGWTANMLAQEKEMAFKQLKTTAKQAIKEPGDENDQKFQKYNQLYKKYKAAHKQLRTNGALGEGALPYDALLREKGYVLQKRFKIHVGGAVGLYKYEGSDPDILKICDKDGNIVLKTPVIREATPKTEEYVKTFENEWNNARYLGGRERNHEELLRPRLNGITIGEGPDQIQIILNEFLPGNDIEHTLKLLGKEHKEFKDLKALEAAGKRPPPFITMFIGAHQSLDQLHGDEMMHGDIAGRNFMFDPNTNKVIAYDFGLSLKLNDKGIATDDPYFNRVPSGFSDRISIFHEGYIRGVKSLFTDFKQFKMAMIESFCSYAGVTLRSDPDKADTDEMHLADCLTCLKEDVEEINDVRKEILQVNIAAWESYLATVVERNLDDYKVDTSKPKEIIQEEKEEEENSKEKTMDINKGSEARAESTAFSASSPADEDEANKGMDDTFEPEDEDQTSTNKGMDDTFEPEDEDQTSTNKGMDDTFEPEDEDQTSTNKGMDDTFEPEDVGETEERIKLASEVMSADRNMFDAVKVQLEKISKVEKKEPLIVKAPIEEVLDEKKKALSKKQHGKEKRFTRPVSRKEIFSLNTNTELNVWIPSKSVSKLGVALPTKTSILGKEQRIRAGQQEGEASLKGVSSAVSTSSTAVTMPTAASISTSSAALITTSSIKPPRPTAPPKSALSTTAPISTSSAASITTSPIKPSLPPRPTAPPRPVFRKELTDSGMHQTTKTANISSSSSSLFSSSLLSQSSTGIPTELASIKGSAKMYMKHKLLAFYAQHSECLRDPLKNKCMSLLPLCDVAQNSKELQESATSIFLSFPNEYQKSEMLRELKNISKAFPPSDEETNLFTVNKLMDNPAWVIFENACKPQSILDSNNLTVLFNEFKTALSNANNVDRIKLLSQLTNACRHIKDCLVKDVDRDTLSKLLQHENAGTIGKILNDHAVIALRDSKRSLVSSSMLGYVKGEIRNPQLVAAVLSLGEAATLCMLNDTRNTLAIKPSSSSTAPPGF